VGPGEASRLVVGDLGERPHLATQAGDDTGEDQHEAVGAGIDDAGLGEHG